MHDMIREIFADAGASEEELKIIEATCKICAEEVRNLVIDCSGVVAPARQMALRVLLARVIHADMEKAFMRYRDA